MTRPKTPRVGRPYVARHTSTLLDTQLILGGNTVRLVNADLQLFSAMQGLEGLVPKNSRELNIALQLDGGPAEVETATAALVRMGKLVDSARDGFWTLTDWELTQADLSGSLTRSDSEKKAQPIRRHNEGAHADKKRDNCELCQQGVPSVDLREQQAPLTQETPNDQPAPVATPAAPAKRTMKAALADFREAIATDLPSFPTPFEGYTAMLDAADELAPLLADLSKDPRAALRNEVLAHALRNLVDEEMTYSGIARANKSAKALGADGHNWWLHAAVLRAGQPYEDEKHCLNDLTTVARGERSKKVSA
ncbi:hypothetical protein [Nocardioides sp. HB32]